MKSGIFDKNGVEVKEGDTVLFPYVDPKGRVHNEGNFKKKIEFKFGCFGYWTKTKFVPLMECDPALYPVFGGDRLLIA